MKSIGFLSSASDGDAFKGHVDAFLAGLSRSGHVNGQNVNVIFKWAGGDYDALRSLVDELVQAKVDIIATTGGAVAALPAVEATSGIPILFISGFDPEQAGLLKGGNATGVNVFSTATEPERLNHLRLLAPDAKQVAVLLRPGTFVFAEEKKVAAKEGLIVVEARDGERDIRAAFDLAIKQGAGGIIVCANPYFTSQYKTITAIANDCKLPNAYVWRQYAEDGGLMSFGPVLSDAYTQIGEYAGAILDGASPGSLPVKTFGIADFKLVINRKATKALGLDIPQSLSRTAEII
jgi:putative ABC transport system substrate-binding protein